MYLTSRATSQNPKLIIAMTKTQRVTSRAVGEQTEGKGQEEGWQEVLLAMLDVSGVSVPYSREIVCDQVKSFTKSSKESRKFSAAWLIVTSLAFDVKTRCRRRS